MTATDPRAESAGMNDAEHRAALAVAAVFGHDRDTLADKPDLLTQYLRAGRQAVAALVQFGEQSTRDTIAETLFDLAHECCNEGCHGGGRAWYDGPAARLGPHSVLAEVAVERQMQDDQWGEQNHPDGTGQWVHERTSAELARAACQRAADEGTLTWAHILREEVTEALAESDPARLRAELVQVAAVAAAWVEAIDRRAEAGRQARRAEAGR
jgi:hypothetical protein